MFSEDICVHEIELDEATALYANKSLEPGYAMQGWWQAGLEHVSVIRR